MAEIEAAFEGGDGDALRTLVHQLKGAGGSYGLMPLSRSAAELELLIRSGAPRAEVAAAKDELFSLCRRAMAATAPPPEPPAHHSRA
jgi:HPt (histidine-containing phosphotransfer) domain-containing protein